MKYLAALITAIVFLVPVLGVAAQGPAQSSISKTPAPAPTPAVADASSDGGVAHTAGDS